MTYYNKSEKKCKYIICLDLSQCYYLHLGRLAWAVCLRLLVGPFKGFQRLEQQKSVENLLEICRFVKWISSFKKCSLAKLIKTLVFSLGLLAASLLLWGCSTFSSSQYSAPYTQIQPSLLLPLQKVKSKSILSGDSLSSQVEQKSPQALLRDTSLWSQSPPLGR